MGSALGCLHLPSKMRYPARASLLVLTANWANAHSWVEQLANIASNGSYVASFGYPRGFADKQIGSSFNQEANKWLLPPDAIFINETDLLCHPSQRVPNQAGSFSRLQTSPDSVIAMRYAENGHVTIPGGGIDLVGKPEKGGTVFVFGTKQPRSDETLQNVLHWTRDGNGPQHLSHMQIFPMGRTSTTHHVSMWTSSLTCRWTKVALCSRTKTQ